MVYTNYLFEYIGEVVSQLEKIRINGIKNDLSFSIDCSTLLDCTSSDLRKTVEYKPIFDLLKTVNGPVLYWFEITSTTDRKAIIAALNAYNNEVSARATPALRSSINFDSNVLYVGKVKKAFSNRLLQHLGYFSVAATQGLQLLHWTQNSSLSLKVNLIEFEDDIADFMPVIEYAFAKKLHPLIGKHK